MKHRYVFQEQAEGDGENGKGSGDGENSLTQEAFDQLKNDNAKMLTDNASMKAKMDDLLSETKKAKSRRKETEEAATQAAEDLARKNGNFEELHKSSEDARSDLQGRYDKLKTDIGKEKCRTAANMISAELAEGQSAKHLSTFIEPRLKFVDGEVKILDIQGQLTVSTIKDLTAEFRDGGMYDMLITGSKASGGGATGGKGGGATGKVLTRADFDKLHPNKRMEFMKKGGKTID